jgi:hypothetical protein
MESSNTIRIATPLSAEDAATRLSSAIRATGLGERLLPTKIRLGGEVNPPGVRLYRDRVGRHWYLSFVGTFRSEGSTTILEGRFLPTPPVFIFLIVGILLAMAAIALLLPPFNWRGMESIGAMMVGTLAALSAMAILWLRRKNMQSEAELLRRDIERLLEGRVGIRNTSLLFASGKGDYGN